MSSASMFFLGGFIAGLVVGVFLGVAFVAKVRASRIADELQQRFEQEELERLLFGNGPRPPRPHPSMPLKKG